MLKRYYSIEEAAEFLTSESGQNITRMDVLTLARHGDIRLYAWVDERLNLLVIDDDPNHPMADFHDSYHFKGYIQIPKHVITPSGGEVTFSPEDSIEAICGSPPAAEAGYPYCFSHIKSNCDSAVIPAEDLLNLIILNNKESERLRAEKKLTTNERNSLLTIIGLMAKDGYGDDLNKTYPLAKEILKTAELLGIKISDDTIASKLKEAKAILDENSE